ncbi:MAG: hypothetical protein NC393_08910 [Clostridium sp.]|nr:hypothetical protein [Clostridium sp.]MCM1172231.1 hypothetical protein [Clostridium sp.]MCM1209269.1 hypothetical protein [Ruminococcus sp.]
MKKIYEGYHSNKIGFYAALCIYSEVISVFCIGLFSSVLAAEISAPGSPELVTDLSVSGSAIFISIMTVGIVLLLTPAIWLTVKAVRDKVKAGQIFAIWVCVTAACALGVILDLNGWNPMSKLSDVLISFLDGKFHIFVTSYKPLM